MKEGGREGEGEGMRWKESKREGEKEREREIERERGSDIREEGRGGWRAARERQSQR